MYRKKVSYKELKPKLIPVRKHQVHKNKKKLIPRKQKHRGKQMINPFAPTVDKVIASFNRQIDRLVGISQRKRGEVSSMQVQIDALNSNITTASVEADRADKIAKKISDLIKA